MTAGIQKYKYIFTFKKTGMLVFISHLDLMRLFERAFIRSGLPLYFSEGFNPHMRLSLPFPLPVGVEGKKEYGEILLTQTAHPEHFVSVLNGFLPADIQLLSVKRVEFKESLHTYLNSYEYSITFAEPVDPAMITSILEQATIPFIKENKRGAFEDDMKRYLYSYHVTPERLVLALVEHEEKALRIDAALKILNISNMQVADIVREAIHLSI